MSTLKVPAIATDITKRLYFLRIAVAAAYLAGILLSPGLWFGLGRTFPRTPLVSSTPAFLSHADFPLSVLLLAALLISAFSKRSAYLIVVVILTILLVVLDQNRLQPWVYQYTIVLALLACFTTSQSKRDNVPFVFLASQLVVALLYFWSGAQKLNWSFGHEVVPGFLETARIYPPAWLLSSLPAIAIVVATIEMLIGIGLMVRKTRRATIALAVALHCVVLILLVPARRNSVVWPWNVAMMVMVVTLFWGFDGSLCAKELWRGRASNWAHHLPKVVVLICGFAPALSFFGWWDIYLSGALYSGTAPVAVVHVSDQLRSRLPAPAQTQIFATSRGEAMLPLYEWSMTELNVPPYPEVRVYRQLARNLCGYADEPWQIELIIKERPALMNGEYRVSKSDCSTLLSR